MRGTTQKLSLALAVALVLIGGGLAVRSLMPLMRSHEPRATSAPLSEAASRLGPELLDAGGDAEASDLAVSRAQSRVREILRAESFGRVVAASRREDLVDAFAERLIATLDGEYARDMAARVARGMTPPGEPTDTALENYTKTADWTRGSRIGIGALEIRVIDDAGRAVAAAPVAEGYDALSYTKKGPLAFPISSDPVGSRLDVVEVRLPMGLRPIEGDSRGAVLVGYQFAWSGQRRQWIPLTNVVYRAQGERYAAVPF